MAYAFVALNYKVPLERILQSQDQHRAYLRTLHAAGKMVCSGPFVPRTGGALLLRVANDAELQAILAADPFGQEGLVEYTVYNWAPNIGNEGLDTLAPGPK